MGRIIAMTNQKGGVGKTTSAVNLAASLAATKRKILLIDLDPQGNATGGSGIDKDKLVATSNEVLLDQVDLEGAIQATKWGYDILPANGTLTVAEVQLIHLQKREMYLQRQLNRVESRYDYILIDCPPSLNTLTINALVAAHSVLVPVQCEYYALEGLTSLLNSIDKIKRRVNTELEIEGLLRTMYDGRNRLTIEVSEQLIQHFPGQVYQTVIPRNVRLAEAPSHGTPVMFYDKASQGASAYLALAGEILQKAAKKTQGATKLAQAIE